MRDGRAYRQIARNVSLLRYLDDPDGLVAEMRSILDGPGWDDPETGSSGWNTVMDQAGPNFVWEWHIMDRTAPWADCSPSATAGTWRSPSRTLSSVGGSHAQAVGRRPLRQARLRGVGTAARATTRGPSKIPASGR